MCANFLKKLLATGLVLGLSSVSAAQMVSDLRPSWSIGAMAEGWRAVCGDVRNVGSTSPGCRDQGSGARQRRPSRQHEGS